MTENMYCSGLKTTSAKWRENWDRIFVSTTEDWVQHGKSISTDREVTDNGESTDS